MGHKSFFLYLAVLYFVASTMVLGQSTTGTILGEVTDPTGAVVAKAHVTVTNTLTGETHSADTNDDGTYVIPHLPIGVYRVESQISGFKRTAAEGVTLAVNQEARVNLALRIGQANEKVEVQADSVQVNTYTPELGELVDAKRVADLPLNGRNVYSLLATLPGTTNINAQTVPSRDNNTFVVNGGRSTTNSCFIDGGFNNDIWRNSCSTPPNPDSVQEFRLLSSNADVEFGRMPGAFMNIVTKSGTNSFHGSAYEYLRNNALDAIDYFNTSVTPLRQNQYGGSLGGPVLKNKLFLFGSWEELKQRTASQSQFAPATELERQGDFSQSTNKPIDPATGQRYPDDKLPNLNPVGLAIVNATPLPNQPDGTYILRAGTPVDEWQYLLKGDYQISQRQKVSVSWFQMNTVQGNPFGWPNQIPSMGGRVDGARQHNLVVNHTWTFSNNLINEIRFNTMRRETPWHVAQGETLDGYGMAYHQGGVRSSPPIIFVDGRFNTGAWDATGLDRSIGGSDTVTWIKGKHNIKLGMFVMRGYYSEAGISWGGGELEEHSDYTGNPLANLLLGYATNFNEDSGHNPDESAWYLHPYAQDTWQITRRLTLTAGLRYELTTPLVWSVNHIISFRQGIQSTVYPNAPTGMLFYGDSGVERAGRPTVYNSFAPRLGLAYDPFGDGKTSIRAGYGVYYIASYGDGIRAPQPYVLSAGLLAVTDLSNPWANYAGGDPFPYTVPTGANATFKTPMSLVVFDKNARTPYINQLNFSVQRQVTKDLSVQAAYVGTLSRKMSGNIDQNNPVYGPGATSANVDARRPILPGVLQAIGTYVTAFNASYHSLQIVANQRMSHGLSFNFNYTWAKGLDLASTDNYNGGLIFTDESKPSRDKGPADGLPHHLVHFSGTYESPKAHRLGRVGNYLVNGWQVNAMLTLRSGTPFTINSGKDSNADGVWNDRPSLVGNPHAGVSWKQLLSGKYPQYFDPAAFAEVPAGTLYGNVGRNSMFGPGYVNADMSFFRIFPIHERHALQFRAEMFNAFNHVNLNNPGNSLTGWNYGYITSTSPARVMQMGLRYSF